MNEARRIASSSKADILQQLRSEIWRLEGFKPASAQQLHTGLGPIQQAFPHQVFPTAAIHEFVVSGQVEQAATGGFLTGIIASLFQTSGAAIWIGSEKKIFPPALKHFGIAPERIVFIQLKKEKEILWALEEALKCPALSAVIGEVPTLSFTASRRLQLAVEQSKVTGFVLRNGARSLNTTACVARWKITPLSSEIHDGLPGLGFPRWRVELLKIRNGKPGCWTVEWHADGFHVETEQPAQLQEWQSKIA